MKKILFLFVVFSSFQILAEKKELAPGLFLDTSKFTLKTESCGEDIPGEMCLIQCFNVDNTNSDLYYTCNLEATANFNEKITLNDGGTLYTGNTLSATDFRSVTIYPYQKVAVCFNYGKEVVSAPAQPNALWVFGSSSISSKNGNGEPCQGGTTGPEPTNR